MSSRSFNVTHLELCSLVWRRVLWAISQTILLARCAPLLLLGGCIPPFLTPRVVYTEATSAYAFPYSDSRPFVRLSNGLDFYGWHDCHRFVQDKGPCSSLQLTGIASPNTPKWDDVLHKLFSTSLRTFQFRQTYERPLSAAADTDYRLLGTSDYGFGYHDVILVAPSRSDDASERDFDALKATIGGIMCPRPRKQMSNKKIHFIIFDESESIWIFAEEDAACKVDLIAPGELISVDGDAKNKYPVLQRPMLLYYKSGKENLIPRLVTRNASHAKETGFVLIEGIKFPNPKVLVFDDYVPDTEVVTPTQPTILCKYDRTYFYISVFGYEEVKLPYLDKCVPYADETLRRLRK